MINDKLKRKGQKFERGLAFPEILIVIAILGALAALIFSIGGAFGGKTALANNAQEIINDLRLAKEMTIASDREASWGIYFSMDAPDQYTLFKGVSYAARDVSFDQVHNLSGKIEISSISLTGGGQEVVFDRITGQTLQGGTVSLRLKSDLAQVATIRVESSGKITLGQDSAPDQADLIKDSRHVHFDYGRQVDTSTENLILIFTLADNSTMGQEIIIANYFDSGRILWQGEVAVDGQNQKLENLNHRLNNPDTQFSIKRDKRYNTKKLRIEISGDATGDLLEYSADGQTSAGTSIYASTPAWQ